MKINKILYFSLLISTPFSSIYGMEDDSRGLKNDRDSSGVEQNIILDGDVAKAQKNPSIPDPSGFDHLSELPAEIKGHISQFMSPKGIVNLSRTNKSNSDAIDSRDFRSGVSLDSQMQFKEILEFNLNNPKGLSQLISYLTYGQNHNILISIQINFALQNGSVLTQISQILPLCTHVRLLNLGSNKIGDDVTTALANFLTKNTTLTQLDLRRNEIGDDGARALAQPLTQNKTLTQLDLGYNQIGPAGARALADGLNVNQTLTQLNLSRNVTVNGTTPPIIKAEFS